MATLNKFDPTKSMYMRGFDRRGCTASLNNTTSDSLIVSGNWADIADFVVLMLYDADDLYGHTLVNKYLPDFDLTDLVLDFDLAIVNCISPASLKFQSVPWGKLSYILNDSAGTSGTYDLDIVSTTGEVSSTITYTVTTSAAPAAFDRVTLIYLGNTAFDYIVVAGDTTSTISAALVSQINASTGTSGLTAVQSGASFTITADTSFYTGVDGNTVSFAELNKNSTAALTPVDSNRMKGGVDPTSISITLDFNTLFGGDEDKIRQLWLTIAPPLPITTVSAATIPLVAFTDIEFSYTISNLVLSGSGNKVLKVADRNSVLLNSRDVNVVYAGSWALQSGFYNGGFCHVSSTVNDTVTIIYWAQATHDLYLGTSLYTDRGKFEVTVDGSAGTDIQCYANVLSELITRRIVATGLATGMHTIILKIKSGYTSGTTCYFDYLQALVASDLTDPAVTYSLVSAAMDFDTDQTYKLSPARIIWNYQQLGLLGNIDFYAGIFFQFKRIRYIGFFSAITIQISGTLDTGTGFGDGDAFFITVGGTTIGVAAWPTDTVSTVARRFANAVNNLFVGVRGTVAGAGEFVITLLSPINGFSVSIDDTGIVGSATFTVVSGDLDPGNEGIWQISYDIAPFNPPLNRAFQDFLEDFSILCVAESFTFTLAYSQELIGAPETDSAGAGTDSTYAFVQRYDNGDPVITSTAFGTWGAGVIAAVSGSGTITITQFGHGYYNGFTVIINGSNYIVTVIGYDSYTIVGSASVGDTVAAIMQSVHCGFNPIGMTALMSAAYIQSASIMDAAGVTSPILQFGEILHWFFDNGTSMALYDENQKAEAVVALGRALETFATPDDDPSVNTYDDADFLRDRIKTHINTIISDVLAVVPTALFELLWPNDVNWPVSFTNAVYPFYLGGQLNRYINLPIEYYDDTSTMDLIKVEALAWGVSYRDLNNTIDSIKFAFTGPLAWPKSKISYLIPNFNGGCPWLSEYRQTLYHEIGNGINFFALDHIILFGWDMRKLANKVTSGSIS